ncbi:MAG: hypothetical protein U0401_06105 [Anaerolineae bacterium]
MRPLWHYTLAFDALFEHRFVSPGDSFHQANSALAFGGRTILMVAIVALLYLCVGTGVFYQDILAFVSPIPSPPTATPAPRPFMLPD